jgi:hypothetical protein
VKRVATVLALVALLATGATGTMIWLLTMHRTPNHPEISAYTHGQLVRIGPYRYCDVIDLNKCDFPQTTGQLEVSSRDPVQLSVPPAIARAPWVLLRAYEGSDGPIPEVFLPNEKLAVTIPTVDPHYGKLTGLAIQLPTLVRDQDGNEFPLPHAEWSVRTVWT